MIKMDERSLTRFGYMLKVIFRLNIEARCRLKQWKYEKDTYTKHNHSALINCGWPASTLWIIYRVEDGKVY